MKTTPVLLEVLFNLRFNLQLGKSVPFALASTIQQRKDTFSKCLKVWLFRYESGQQPALWRQGLTELESTVARQTFLRILERGLAGAPIDENLGDLEKEFFSLTLNLYEKHLQVLPLKLLLPLLLLILPGVLLLLMGPLLFSVVNGF